LAKKGIINSLSTRTDNGNQEITVYWIRSKLDNCEQSSIQESRQNSVELTPKSEPSAKRISTGSSHRSMASIISKAQSKLNSSYTLTPSSSSTQTPLKKKSSLPSSTSAKRSVKSKFKSPLSRNKSLDPEVKALMDQKQKLEKEIAKVEESIRTTKLVLKYQETVNKNNVKLNRLQFTCLLY
jgi:hypothetical protein